MRTIRLSSLPLAPTNVLLVYIVVCVSLRISESMRARLALVIFSRRWAARVECFACGRCSPSPSLALPE